MCVGEQAKHMIDPPWHTPVGLALVKPHSVPSFLKVLVFGARLAAEVPTCHVGRGQKGGAGRDPPLFLTQLAVGVS